MRKLYLVGFTVLLAFGCRTASKKEEGNQSSLRTTSAKYVAYYVFKDSASGQCIVGDANNTDFAKFESCDSAKTMLSPYWSSTGGSMIYMNSQYGQQGVSAQLNDDGTLYLHKNDAKGKMFLGVQKISANQICCADGVNCPLEASSVQPGYCSAEEVPGDAAVIKAYDYSIIIRNEWNGKPEQVLLAEPNGTVKWADKKDGVQNSAEAYWKREYRDGKELRVNVRYPVTFGEYQRQDGGESSYKFNGIDGVSGHWLKSVELTCCHDFADTCFAYSIIKGLSKDNLCHH